MRFYVIDDDDIYRFLAIRTIKLINPGSEVLAFSNAEEALQKLQSDLKNSEQLPDRIFLDINMPVMDGWGFLEGLKQFYDRFGKPVGIYVVSSSIFKKDQEKALSFSFVNSYLEKPIDPSYYA
jgi:two-component system, chemotaxis family, chemotaxis protein CheY